MKSKAGIGVQRVTWIMASRRGRWPSLAPAKNSLRDRSKRRFGPESRASWLTVCTAERTAQETHGSGDYGSTGAEADYSSENGAKTEVHWAQVGQMCTEKS